MLRNRILYREEVGRGVGREEVERSVERSAGGSVGRRSGASREELQSVANRMLFRVSDMQRFWVCSFHLVSTERRL